MLGSVDILFSIPLMIILLISGFDHDMTPSVCSIESAEKDLRSATELLKHAASALKILKLGSVEDQSNYVSTWSRILSVCALELKQGASIWKQSLQKNLHSQLLSKSQGASPKSRAYKILCSLCCINFTMLR